MNVHRNARLTPIGRERMGASWYEHRFAQVRAELGLAGDLHFHGLRHTMASQLAESGASDAEIQSVTGHKTRAMVAHYTEQARQRRLAAAAIARLPGANIQPLRESAAPGTK